MSHGTKDSISTLRHYMNQVGQWDVLDTDTFNELHAQFIAGDEQARNKLIAHNLRLVVKLARTYTQSDDQLLDLIEEGNLGLIRALEKFDPERGFAFSTYADRWIRYRIEHYMIHNDKVVKVPTHTLKFARKVYKTQLALQQTDNAASSVEAVADALGEDVDKVSKIMGLNQVATSMDSRATFEDSEGATFGEMLEDERDEQSAIEQDDLNQWIMLKLDELNDKQRDAIIHHFGMVNTDAKNFADIGRVMGLSRERARQLVGEGINKLRQMAERDNVNLAAMVA